MHRFIIDYGVKEKTLDIENYKFLIGDNYREKFKIFETIRSCFNKVPNSEFAIENNLKHKMFFDEKPLDPKQWRYFELTPFFDVETDIKLGTKSLMGKYLDSFANDLEQNEIFNTLQILINSLNDEFFDKETCINLGDKEFKLQLSDVNRSTISKEIIGHIIHNNFECNSSDLSYEEIILLQLKIIDVIASKNNDKLMFVYCNFPYLTSEIKTYITGMKYENLFILIDTLHISNISISDIAVSSKHYIDFTNEEVLLDVMMDFPFHISLESLLEKCQNSILTNCYNPKDSLIIEIFPWEIYSKNS